MVNENDEKEDNGGRGATKIPFGQIAKIIILKDKEILRDISLERDRTKCPTVSGVLKKILREYFARQAVKREMAADSLMASMPPIEQR